MSLITKGTMVFDIGANVGQTALRFVLHGAKVYAVEPCIENFLALMQVPNTVPIHAACWQVPGLEPISYAINQPGLSSLLKGKWSAVYQDTFWADARWVPCLTLDLLRDKFGIPDVVKIDVEGAELPVMKGMTFRSPLLFFEFHRQTLDETAACLLYLQELGYQKAHYVREDIDLETVPTTPIPEFSLRLQDDNPEWGNITVC